jgi:hypothetical protein
MGIIVVYVYQFSLIYTEIAAAGTIAVTRKENMLGRIIRSFFFLLQSGIVHDI